MATKVSVNRVFQKYDYYAFWKWGWTWSAPFPSLSEFQTIRTELRHSQLLTFYAVGNLSGRVFVGCWIDAIQVRSRFQTAKTVQSLYFWNILLAFKNYTSSHTQAFSFKQIQERTKSIIWQSRKLSNRLCTWVQIITANLPVREEKTLLKINEYWKCKSAKKFHTMNHFWKLIRFFKADKSTSSCLLLRSE